MGTFLPKKEADKVVFDYQPKTFPVVASEPAQDFVSSHEMESSDFAISELTAEQSGIRDLNRSSIDKRVEELALERLKEIEEKAYSEAYELGLIEGTEKAFQERKEEFDERIHRIDELLTSFDVVKKKVLKENEVFFIKAVYQIAQKIAIVEIKQNKNIIIELMTKMIEDVHSDEKMHLNISPDDYLFISQLLEKNSKDYSFLNTVKLEIDDSIEPGGCSLQTSFGTIDATIEERIQRVWEHVEAKMPQLIGHDISLEPDPKPQSENQQTPLEEKVESSSETIEPHEEEQKVEEIRDTDSEDTESGDE